MVASRDLYAFNINISIMKIKNNNLDMMAMFAMEKSSHMYIYVSATEGVPVDCEARRKEIRKNCEKTLAMMAGLNFQVEKRSFEDLLNLAISMSKTDSIYGKEDLGYSSDPKKLYEVCSWCLYELTDVNLVYDETLKYGREQEWIVDHLCDFLYEKIALIYPYLKDGPTFVRYYRRHREKFICQDKAMSNSVKTSEVDYE